MAQLCRKTGLSLHSLRRYWYNTSAGTCEGAPLAQVHLPSLGKLAAALDVHPRELIEWDDPTAGQGS